MIPKLRSAPSVLRLRASDLGLSMRPNKTDACTREAAPLIRLLGTTRSIGTVIETDRLILRLMGEEDFDEMLRIFSDEKVLSAFNMDSFSAAQMRKWIERNLDRLTPGV